MGHLRHPLFRARGLGSAGSGREHWWRQRITAVALIPLGLWFVVSLLSMSNRDYASLLIWLQSPSTAVLLLAVLLATYYHAMLGLQVVFEDYIAQQGRRIAVLLVVEGILFLAGLSAVLAVGRIFFSGGV